MHKGNWVPLSKALVKHLPLDREYSEIEAMFSLTVNYDNSHPISVSGYASLWGWSRKRVSNFLKKYNLTIDYGDKFDRYKKGSLNKLVVTGGEQVRDRRGTGEGQVEFINPRQLEGQGDRRGTGEEQVRDRRGSTISYPEPKPKEKTIVETPVPQPRIPHKLIVDFLNEKAGTKFRHETKTTQSKIKARFNEGFSFEDFKAVIEFKTNEWLTDEKYCQYLRPDTLFGTKFEGYLQAAKKNDTLGTGRQGTWKAVERQTAPQ